MKKIVLLSNLVLLLALVALDIAYIVEGTLLLKSFASAMFVLVGAVNLAYAIKTKAKLQFPILMLVGLVFAMLGDIILNIHFIAGAVLFAVGHVFFFVSYSMLEKFNYKDLIWGLVIFIPSMLLIVLAPIFDFGGALMEVVAVLYALIISLMVGKALSNLIKNRSLLNIIILIGSVMFFLSDLMLLLNVFASLPVVGIICLALYYPAEFLLGFSIFTFANKNQAVDTNKNKPDEANKNMLAE